MFLIFVDPGNLRELDISQRRRKVSEGQNQYLISIKAQIEITSTTEPDITMY